MTTNSVGFILEDFSIEMTGKDIDALSQAHSYLPPSTRVNVAFLGNEAPRTRLAATRAIKDYGLTPVSHIAARRLASRTQLKELLCTLSDAGTAEHIFAVGGDPRVSEGPYESALSLITHGSLTEFGVKTISIGGYPEGHPDIPPDVLWRALTDKAAALEERGIHGDIITQFGFDTDVVVAWIERVRACGILLPIRVGVPGPAGVKRLLGYARRFGVSSSVSIARKYGLTLTSLLTTVGPDRFISELASRYDPVRHGTIKLHFYAFGGLTVTAEWVHNFAAASIAGKFPTQPMELRN